MDRPHIERLRIQNYGCAKDVTLSLTPLHALIGPNDSGKSTVLMALRTLTTLAAGPIGIADDSGKLTAAIEGNPGLVIEGSAGNVAWSVGLEAGGMLWEAPSAMNGRRPRELNDRSASPELKDATVRKAFAGSTLLRLEPDALRMQTQLISEGQPLRLHNALGLGLPAVYDAIVTRDLPAYVAINDRLAALFPTVRSLSLKNPTTTTKAIGVQLKNGTFVGADFVSEGMLYYLAYAALPHLERTAMILIEEPENGLHPARIREVMRVLREISETTQVVLATHSPLVINELEPNEVTVLTRTPDQGTRATLMKDTPNFLERSKVYSLGELWVSYADGNVEAPLFTEPEPPSASAEAVEWNDG